MFLRHCYGQDRGCGQKVGLLHIVTNDEIHKRTNSYRITVAGFYWFPKKGYRNSWLSLYPMLYHWRKKYPELYTSPQMNHWKQASPEFKLEIIQRCFIDGENVKSVSEEIGYTPSSIYGWYRRYRKKLS